MALYAATIVITLLPDRSAPLPAKRLPIALAPGVIASLVGIVKLARLSSAAGDIGAGAGDNPLAAKLAEAMAATISPGIGLILVAGAGIVAAGLGFALRRKEAALLATGV
jgi:hypothetical protein